MKSQFVPACIVAPKTALAVSVLLAWLFCAIPPAQAGAVTASITVKAVVLTFAAVKTISEPSTLTITEADVRRRFVDGSSPSLIELRTNSPRGCVLTLEAGDSPFEEAEVTFQGHTVVVSRQGGMLVLQSSGRRVVSMSYRFILAHDARPGAYPWPFFLSVSPLE